jgi:hypothetical protein
MWRGHRRGGRLLFFEDEIRGGGAGGDLDPVGDAGGDVDDVSGVEGNLFSALNAGAESFARGGSVGAFLQHGAAIDEDEVAVVDVDLVGPELMTLSVAGVEADDEEGAVVAVVVDGSNGEAFGACLGGFNQFGFALLEIGGGVEGGGGGLGSLGRLGDEGLCCDECDGQGDAT